MHSSHGSRSEVRRGRLESCMIEPLRSDPLCIRCNARMRFSCKETEKPGFIHDVFECPKCRSTQSYITSEQAPQLGTDRRVTGDRRSRSGTRSEAEKQMVGERRSQIARRSDQNKRAGHQPTADQLSVFAKRVKRAMRDEKSRHFFCVASGEDDFRGHADVLRVLEWIEDLARD
jgi:hypothetical protein